jgi:hypothetical protein
MVARVQFPCLPSYRKTSPSPPTGDHEGNKCRSQPHIHHPRPYGSPSLLPDFPAEVDAHWRAFMVTLVLSLCTLSPTSQGDASVPSLRPSHPRPYEWNDLPLKNLPV